MIWAEWKSNLVRTRFVEFLTQGSDRQYETEAPVRLVGFAGGTLPGPFLEPKDCFSRIEDGTVSTTLSSKKYHKKCQYTLPIKALNELLEDTKTGESKPTPLHSFGWDWLD
jgi:hypothetical protein